MPPRREAGDTGDAEQAAEAPSLLSQPSQPPAQPPAQLQPAVPPADAGAPEVTFATAAEAARAAGYSDAQVAAAGSAIEEFAVQLRSRGADEVKADEQLLAALDAAPRVPLNSEEAQAAQGEEALLMAGVQSAWMSRLAARRIPAAKINEERAWERSLYVSQGLPIPEDLLPEHDRPDDGLGGGAGPATGAVDARNAEQATALSSLPLPLQHRIFLALAVDARARCCCVCRAWRDALAPAELWTRLDLSRYSGVTVALTEAVVEGAVRRARGQLYRLDFRYRHDSERNPQLMRLAPTFADSLRELRLGSVPTRSVTHQHDEQRPDLSGEALLTALPRLELLELDSVDASYEEAQAVLRAEAPWTALRFRSLALVTAGPWTPVGPLAGADRVLPFATALADTSLQPTLSSLTLYSTDLQPLAVMNAVVDGVLARRLPELELLGCSPPAAAPLARLLGANVLTSLSFLSSSFHMPQAPPFDAAGGLLLAGALRANTALTRLSLIRLGMCRDMDAALTVLRALVGHPSLRSFKLWGEGEADRSVLGTALSALIAANAPALEELNFASSELGVLGLTPIVEALPLNHHLLKLHIPYHNMDEAFAAEVLLPAVRANTSLRVLYCTGMNAPGPAKEAEELVERRRSLLR